MDLSPVNRRSRSLSCPLAANLWPASVDLAVGLSEIGISSWEKSAREALIPLGSFDSCEHLIVLIVYTACCGCCSDSRWPLAVHFEVMTTSSSTLAILTWAA